MRPIRATPTIDASLTTCTSLVLPLTVEVWMGVKEEKLADRILFGYAGQLRPLQMVGGACTVCGREVWIDIPEPLAVRSTSHTHFSCHNGQWLLVQTLFPKPHKANGIATALVAKRK